MYHGKKQFSKDGIQNRCDITTAITETTINQTNFIVFVFAVTIVSISLQKPKPKTITPTCLLQKLPVKTRNSVKYKKEKVKNPCDQECKWWVECVLANFHQVLQFQCQVFSFSLNSEYCMFKQHLLLLLLLLFLEIIPTQKWIITLIKLQSMLFVFS